MLFNKKLVCCQLKSGLIWLIWLIWLICWWQQVWVGWLVVRCVGDRSCTVQPHHVSTATSQETSKGRHKTFSCTQDAMCWSTLTSRSTFGLRKAREKYWIGLGTGKPVSEYSYWGSRSSMLASSRSSCTSARVNPTCCAFVVPHSWRVWQPVYRPIHPAEAAGVPPGPRPHHSLPLRASL